jgi:serine/threonine protein kinase
MAENNTFLKIISGLTLSYTSESFNHFAFAVNGSTAIVVSKKFAEGSYKDASEAYVLNTCERIVELKIVERLKSGAIDLTNDEKDLLKKIAKNNPYLIPPYECVINKSSEKKLIMFQPFFDGDGAKLKNASAFQLTMIFRDVACGLARMHRDGYVHSDFKPANMFFKGNLASNEPLEGKVADIGMAQIMDGYIRGGSIAYLPPEVITYSGYQIALRPRTKVDDKLDSFSLGVSMFEILNGSLPWTPFGLMSSGEVKNQIDSLQSKYIWQNKFFPFEKTLLLKMVDLTRGLLIQDKKQRFSCQKIADDLGISLSSL